MKQNDDLIFTFGSQNSAIDLSNGKNFMFLDSTQKRKELFEYFQGMTNEKFTQQWFESHNRVSDLMSSGFTVERIVTIVVFYEPTTQSVDKILSY